jgi:hypothetical protein
MLKSEVATGRFMNGEEMCIFYPECPILAPYDIETKVKEGLKACLGYKNSLRTLVEHFSRRAKILI